MCSNAGAFSAGGTLQNSVYESIARVNRQIDDIKAQKAETQSGINDIIRFTPPNERDDFDRRILKEYRDEIKGYNNQIAELQDEIKAIKKAGREENKGQLTFFSMRKTR